MALGRVPIPIDKAEEIARAIEIDPPSFLIATLKQRHPDVDFEALFGTQKAPDSVFAGELATVAGSSLDELPGVTKHVLREAASARQPERRWLTSPELAAIEMLRQRFPDLARDGLSSNERQALQDCLDAKLHETAK